MHIYLYKNRCRANHFIIRKLLSKPELNILQVYNILIEKGDPYFVQYVDRTKITQTEYMSLCKKALTANFRVIYYISEHNFALNETETESESETESETNLKEFQNKILLYVELCRFAINIDVEALKFINTTIITSELYNHLCLFAATDCNIEKPMLQFVNHYKLSTHDYTIICATAVTNNSKEREYVKQFKLKVGTYKLICGIK
jgi:hypothetical protein